MDLTGQGGNLENSQPLPTGAAKLTTDSTDAAKAQVGVGDNYGTIANILSALKIDYSFFKASGGSPAPAPALNLIFSNSSYVGDGFVTLVYEPYWHGSDPSVNTWTDASVDHAGQNHLAFTGESNTFMRYSRLRPAL